MRGIALNEVRVPLRRGDRCVPQNIFDLEQVRTVLRHPRGGGMAQVMEAEMPTDLRALDGSAERRVDATQLRARSREDLIATQRPRQTPKRRDNLADAAYEGRRV